MAQKKITAAQLDIPDIQAEIDAPQVFSQDTEPSSGMEDGDIWFNTLTKNMYVYVGTAWVLQGQDDGFF